MRNRQRLPIRLVRENGLRVLRESTWSIPQRNPGQGSRALAAFRMGGLLSSALAPKSQGALTA